MLYPDAGPGPGEWSVWDAPEDDADRGTPIRTYRGRGASARAQLVWAGILAKAGLRVLWAWAISKVRR